MYICMNFDFKTKTGIFELEKERQSYLSTYSDDF